ncbi:juxtaposed with another zinc finger protein 1b isoform X2 [Brienomyrus brachyistius]|uniref:juxtaposed with another zinc finger protein 1b isoform X2 n=1 Tax=Brienomyrus brachyistius TaxID=42636 RepID=UPI0020B2C934|nr:juxtaposed with another zinc finger protein 1b isoform X2 [Brienomyrus brachyistius]
MTGIAAASFFSNTCRFGGCGLHFETLAELIVHIEDNHIDTDPRVLEKQELQQPTYVALSYINRFMTDAARREQETLKKKVQPKLSLPLTGGVSRNSVSTPPRHSSGSLTPPVTPPITPSSSFRSSTPTGRPLGLSGSPTSRSLGLRGIPVNKPLGVSSTPISRPLRLSGTSVSRPLGLSDTPTSRPLGLSSTLRTSTVQNVAFLLVSAGSASVSEYILSIL